MSLEKDAEPHSPLARSAFVDRLYVSALLRFTAAEFVIRSRPTTRVLIVGRVPSSKVGAIQTFFKRDIGTDAPTITVCGGWPARTRSAAGALRLKFLGEVDARLQQRVRNFLMEILR